MLTEFVVVSVALAVVMVVVADGIVAFPLMSTPVQAYTSDVTPAVPFVVTVGAAGVPIGDITSEPVWVVPPPLRAPC